MNSISICLTDKCTATCKHCCMSCSPQGESTLDQDKILEVLDQISNIDKIQVVNITGGEPFIYYDFLKIVLSKINAIGRRATLITNGFWAVSEKDTEEKLLDLINCGLKSLSVSLSEFHNEFVALDNINNIINVARQLPISLNLKIAVTKDKMAFDLLSKIGDNIVDVPIYFFSVASVGRAQEISDNRLIKKYYTNKRMHCSDKELVIYNNGDCYPCCSPAIFDTCFKIGNIFETSLDELIRRVDCNLLLHYLRKKGVDWYKDILVDNFNYKFADSYVSPCVLCADIFRNADVLKDLTPFLKDYYEKDHI